MPQHTCVPASGADYRDLIKATPLSWSPWDVPPQSKFLSLIAELRELKFAPANREHLLEALAQMRRTLSALVAEAVHTAQWRREWVHGGPLIVRRTGAGFVMEHAYRWEFKAWRQVCNSVEAMNRRLAKLGLEQLELMPYREFSKIVDAESTRLKAERRAVTRMKRKVS